MLEKLSPYMLYIKLAFIAIVFSGGVLVGIHHEQPKIDRLNQTIGGYTETITSLTANTVAQNKGIEDLKIATAEREKAAKDAVDAAQNDAVDARNTAAALLAKKPPKGDQCVAASKDFANALRAERKNKK